MDIHTLERSKQQWQSAVDLMPQLVCLVNREGRLLHVNRTMERWGLGNVAAAKGRLLHDILHRDCSDPDCSLLRIWDEATPSRMAGKRVVSTVFDPLLRRHISIRIQPLVGRQPVLEDASEDLHTVVVVDDVSDLMQAEAENRRRNEELAQQVAQEVERRELSEEMQARLLTILEKTTDYVAMADVSESMLYLNPAGRAMLGLGQADDISQKKLCDHADSEVRQNIRDIAIPIAIENGLWEGESRIRDNAGREIYTSQVIIAHRGADGQIDCFSTILRDISNRVRAEQALRESQEALRQVSGLLVSIQEDERRRIALDLHDGLGQSLSLIKLSLEKTVEQVSAGAAAGALEALRQLVPRVSEALHDVRRVASELSPAILDDLGILATFSWFLREFEALCSHIVVEKMLHVSEQEVPARLRITLYRILQEATSNIVNHSAADRMRVSLNRDAEGLHLLIEDNGRGFDPNSVVRREGEVRGLGLFSMKERVSLSGGSYRLESSPGFGTRIHASWPLE